MMTRRVSSVGSRWLRRIFFWIAPGLSWIAIGLSWIVIGLTPWTSAQAHAQDKGPDYAALADDFVRSHLPAPLLGERAPALVSIEELLELAYVHVDLGVFRVHYPKRVFAGLSRGRADFETYAGKPNPRIAAKELSAIGRALIELQLRWIELVGQNAPGQSIDERRADERLPGFTAVRNWITTNWRGKGEEKRILDRLRADTLLIDGLGAGPLPADARAKLSFDLVEVLSAEGDAIRADLSSFNAFMQRAGWWSGARLNGELVPGRPLDLVLCPTRGDIVGIALHVARSREMPSLAWHPGIFEYTQFSLPGFQAIAFHYADESDPRNLSGGKFMADIDQTGGVVVQHAVRYAMNLLLEYHYGPNYLSTDAETPESQKRAQRELGALFGGVRKYMVTYLYGRNQIRDEGDEANRTHARSMFIAGGNSEGGSLGMMPAEKSRWRKRANKDGDFLGDLLDHMKFERVGSGADQWVRASVVLEPQGSKRKHSHLLQGPFLARQAGDALPPITGPAGEKDKDREKRLQVHAELAQDYVGFVRAYEIAFYKWLAEEHQPQGAAARERHAALYRRLHETAAGLMDPTTSLDLSEELTKVIAEVYGMPLTSAPVAGPEAAPAATLEQRFLDWLAQKS